MESKYSRRLQTIQNHVTADPQSMPVLQLNQTAGEFFAEQGYSVVLPEKLQTGKWNVHRSTISPLKLLSRFPDHPDIGTLHDNFVYASETFRDYKYLGTRIRADGTVGEYKWTTYGEAATARSAIGSGLVAHGIPKGSSIGLYFINRPEWIIVDHACSAYSYISVPLYDTLGPDAVKYIVNHSSAQAIFCVPETLHVLMSFLSEIPSVRLIVVVGGLDELMPSLPSTTGVKVVSFSKLITQGSNDRHPFRPPKPDDVATICYTSGTTGTPKGVVLSHGNMIANTAGGTTGIKFYPSDVYISYLPLAHIYERSNVLLLAYYGGSAGFYQGDNLKLLDDMAELKPTVFCSVPRLYNRVYDGIINAVKTTGGLRERVFNVAYNAKKQALLTGKNASPMWDRLVFNKIKDKLGGRVRFMFSGASPLSPDVMDFLRVCFGCPVIEGYGMTESSCAITYMHEKDIVSGHVGAPNPACEVKLVDVPEMNYTSDDQPYPRGEICVRGPIVFQGYYKDEVQTREVIDEEGWLHTGDIGLWSSGGRLKIIDRKKNIFKLAQGEYIAPEKIENVYAKSKFVAQCFVYGDSFNSCLVAIVCVDPDMLKASAAKEGIKFESLEQLCNDPRARTAVLADMDAIGKEAQLRGFEFARSITLVAEPFTMENGLLTPTFKVKRPQAKAYFAKAIADMYEEVSSSKLSGERIM
ncbi:long chain acyl-CoA synthetase 6, peroxisomal-like [Cynara cardunculus var. scolymus]|uniref:long chain acyl-CoA synthetase 6, peroxisomal-like n=1 Tax=Cynara cardunculus var. scolymus TaxID=59895 RepID=UPI000D62B140|nr:long chain acyl-CoA synthetase 6, peroxisomal-like [Cynara cardunculus var. scolymus]